VSAQRRTQRDWRRRQLGQNFLRREIARRIVAEAELRPGECVVEIGAGTGALSEPLAACGVELIAIELDPVWAARLRARFAGEPHVRVVAGDFFATPLPRRPFRAFGSLPFGATTDMLRRLLDDPALPLMRADLIVQWEAAQKHAAAPPGSLLAATWAPWWELRVGTRISANAFRPIPRVDAGVLTALRRDPPLLPPAMRAPYRRFVRDSWPFA
jgi:23S rRNA (adenine-N6)-dimethyltransferase